MIASAGRNVKVVVAGSTSENLLIRTHYERAVMTYWQDTDESKYFVDSTETPRKGGEGEYVHGDGHIFFAYTYVFVVVAISLLCLV